MAFYDIISILFLALLLVPIGITIMTLILMSVEDMRKKTIIPTEDVESLSHMPIKQQLRLVK